MELLWRKRQGENPVNLLMAVTQNLPTDFMQTLPMDYIQSLRMVGTPSLKTDATTMITMVEPTAMLAEIGHGNVHVVAVRRRMKDEMGIIAIEKGHGAGVGAKVEVAVAALPCILRRTIAVPPQIALDPVGKAVDTKKEAVLQDIKAIEHAESATPEVMDGAIEAKARRTLEVHLALTNATTEKRMATVIVGVTVGCNRIFTNICTNTSAQKNE
mmetsp:Transcript_19773/g.30517  ORF Transcript_19773/g.30517 Transcript_19773/m.30517 type:complete len:214 (-) Transcript_19773:1828-2469(-)